MKDADNSLDSKGAGIRVSGRFNPIFKPNDADMGSHANTESNMHSVYVASGYDPDVITSHFLMSTLTRLFNPPNDRICAARLILGAFCPLPNMG